MNSQISLVTDFVRAQRARMGISQLGTRIRPEPSCFSEGEIRNLFNFQLLHTQEGYGGWLELNNQEVLEGVIAFITAERSGLPA